MAIPFLLAMWLGNLFAIVPPEATAGALMIVGLLMLAATAAEIPWKDLSVGLPALFALMLMPLTWSITNGIGAGVILYTLLHVRTAAPAALDRVDRVRHLLRDRHPLTGGR